MGFTIGSTLRFAWETFKKRPWLFVLALLLLVIAEGVVEGIGRAIDAMSSGSAEDPPLAVAVVNLAIYVTLTTLISMGTTAFFLAAHDNPDTVELRALWHPQPFWKFLGVTILFWLLTVVGLVLLALLVSILGMTRGLVIGILLLSVISLIFAVMFVFASFLVIDRELGPIKAMEESYRITRGHLWSLFVLLLMLFLINLLGLLALIVGLLVSVPVTLLAFTRAYRVLSGSAGATPPADAALAA